MQVMLLLTRDAGAAEDGRVDCGPGLHDNRLLLRPFQSDWNAIVSAVQWVDRTRSKTKKCCKGGTGIRAGTKTAVASVVLCTSTRLSVWLCLSVSMTGCSSVFRGRRHLNSESEMFNRISAVASLRFQRSKMKTAMRRRRHLQTVDGMTVGARVYMRTYMYTAVHVHCAMCIMKHPVHPLTYKQ